jgi:ABC-type dipeptide/oligopeptide/nickel transport system permease component
MFAFLLRRLASTLAVLACVISITFLLVRLAPGGPFSRERKLPPAIEQQLAAKYQLDGSLTSQFTRYLTNLASGQLGISTKYRDRSVNELIAQSLPVSLTLGFAALLLSTGSGIWLGALAATRKGTWTDTAAMLSALALLSLPMFVAGPLLALFLAIKLPLLPVGGWNSPQSIILPALTLAGPAIAYVARLTRSSLLEVLGQDFVRTARAKGLAERAVTYRHALKVAILPVVSFLGPLAANLLTGSIVVESVFNLPGAGSFFVNSIVNRDVFLLGGIVIVYCTLLCALNLLADAAYAWLNPRIRLAD